MVKIFLFNFIFFSHAFSHQVELKDLINIRGVRTNKLVGYGIVFGLAGTGDSDSTQTTKRSAAMMLTKMGMPTKPEDIPSINLASVVVTADLPAFSRNGDLMDVRVSAQGDAKNIAGGTLLLTPLKGGDGETYAVAQGSVVVGTPQDGGALNLPTIGVITQGASVEREFQSEFTINNRFFISLKRSDFTTNDHIVKKINQVFKGFYARSLDPTNIEVMIPPSFEDSTVSFVSVLEKLKVEVDQKAVVIINERTGTVVMGQDVTIQPVTIAHGNLSIRIRASKAGQQEEVKSLLDIENPTVGGLVETLNKLGVKPVDLVGILQAMSAAGALNAQIQFI